MPNNMGPMRYAIESGSQELIALLISSGANVNDPFGQFQTSPIEWAFASGQLDIARLLVSKGADLDYISSRGSTPVHSLFGSLATPTDAGDCWEFFAFLSANSFQGFDLQDASGWTALHRASSYGTAQGVCALIKVGVSLDVKTHNADSTPIFCATRFNNNLTFLELAKKLPPTFIDTVDSRGWNLLHIAADAGNFEVMRLCHRFGVDVHAIARAPNSLSLPMGDQAQYVTAAELAWGRGTACHQKYIDALKTLDAELVVAEDAVGEPEVFWPAESNVQRT